MQNTYWHNAGKYQADYSRLCDELIPVEGKCDTVAGEWLRSVTRLAYDLYNNGMGNNTSGAANFLLHHGVMTVDDHDVIYDYTRGMLYDGRYEGDALQVAIERTIDRAVDLILSHPGLTTTVNTEDMFDYEEEMQNWCDECGDEISGHFHQYCRHCEEAYEEEEEEY